MTDDAPSLDQIRTARRRLGDAVHTTPVWSWQSPELRRRGFRGQAVLKLEALQVTGSFKARGALLHVLDLSEEARARGVTAVSAGNHAMAVAHAAAQQGSTAKVVMPRSADPARIARCRSMGAEVVLVDDVHAAFAEVARIEAEEGRTFVHPFEGLTTALGTATIGLEFFEQAPDLDAVIIPIGGGGLCAGMATALRRLAPHLAIYGVEPTGADTMHRSFAAGRPMAIDRVDTIADSLGAPHAAPYSYGLCRRYVDDLVLVSDDLLRAAMAVLFQEAKLAVEPAGAASTAALLGPLRERLADQRVGLVVCGANVDPNVWARHVVAGQQWLAEHP
ncbi:threonine ammonia-lyase [Paraliomyxa miuraensis]|uniref:threonine ammonia-lyase n=1 Tax=Paraliomyxa miuraensis TaxID=376150 RepID=UPI00224D3798|nr:threonine/serine dehydratase [Paraliomyxa miuraensis]MCX4245641.1 threonine/serine dehydratase [Paraliomyxa miuraensis]